MKITKAQTKKIAKEFDINLDVIDLDELHFGLNVELEHGKKFMKLTNITNDSIDKTSRIVFAHLIEDPRYYYYLKQMETKREKYWSNKKKPSIFNN